MWAAIFVLATQLQTGVIVEKTVATSDDGVTYAYYIPKSLASSETLPVLFIFDPRSRGAFAAELFREAADEFRWILVSSNETRSDGPLEPNIRAVNGMWRDVHERFPINRKRIYATGFSGGAILSWWLAESSGSVAGIIGIGGRVNAPEKIGAVPFDWFGVAGDTDFNLSETRLIEQKLAAANSSRRLETFEGGHRWAPKELLTLAVEWMEIQAMRRGLCGRDEAMIARAFQRDIDRARNAPDELQSLRMFQTIARSYDGLLDLTEVKANVATLERSPAVKRLEADDRRGIELEAAHRSRMPGVLRRLMDSEETPSAPSLAHELRIGALQKLAAQKTYEGMAARRVLATIAVQLDFYLAAKLSGEKLSVVRSVANMIKR